MRIRNLQVFLLSLLFCCNFGCLAANDTNDLLIERAKEGEVAAQLELGLEYYSGEAKRKKNLKKAFYWFGKAGFQENAEAQYHYGMMLIYGEGVQKNVTLGRKWLQGARNKKFPPAETAFADMALHGIGEDKDIDKAIDSYENAAKEYHIRGAMRSLIEIYSNKEMGKLDFVKVNQWRKVLAETWQDNKARHNLGLAYVKGEGVEKNDTEAIRWFELSANDGINPSKNSLGLIYSSNGPERNCAKAIKWYESAAKKGYTSSQHKLGHLYETGNCVEKNLESAYFWLALAEKNGDEEAGESVVEIAKVLDLAIMKKLNKEINERKK